METVKVPKYIKDKMKSVLYHQRLSAKKMQEVEEWLECNGFDVDELRCGDGASLEELEYGNDVIEDLLAKLEGRW